MCEIINNSPLDTNDIIATLQTVFDPDIHYSVYDIGLIYGVTIEDYTIKVVMTLTSVNCPEAQSLPLNIENALKEKFSDYSVSVDLTFEPEWTVDNMSEEVKLGLGLL
jgi:metal-sulfur cluster biosynthetic enzyme